MTKILIFVCLVFCFGFLAENEKPIAIDLVKETPVVLSSNFDKAKLANSSNTKDESASYREYLALLDQKGPKQESIGNDGGSDLIDVVKKVKTHEIASADSGAEAEPEEAMTYIKQGLMKNSEKERSAALSVDHSDFGKLLKKHVDSNGDVNYKAFKTDQESLEKYIAMLSANLPQTSWSKNERLAYYINVYNANTIKLILDNYPVRSIMDIEGGKPWDKMFIKLGNQSYTLNNIENEIIRKEFAEPRIHFAVNCAAASCPPLLNDAFYPEILMSQLDKQTKAFINNSSYNSISSSELKLSKIFDWYGSDFDGVKDFVSRYTKVDISNSKISFNEYDWTLNAQQK